MVSRSHLKTWSAHPWDRRVEGLTETTVRAAITERRPTTYCMAVAWTTKTVCALWGLCYCMPLGKYMPRFCDRLTTSHTIGVADPQIGTIGINLGIESAHVRK